MTPRGMTLWHLSHPLPALPFTMPVRIQPLSRRDLPQVRLLVQEVPFGGEESVMKKLLVYWNLACCGCRGRPWLAGGARRRLP